MPLVDTVFGAASRAASGIFNKVLGYVGCDDLLKEFGGAALVTARTREEGVRTQR